MPCGLGSGSAAGPAATVGSGPGGAWSPLNSRTTQSGVVLAGRPDREAAVASGVGAVAGSGVAVAVAPGVGAVTAPGVGAGAWSGTSVVAPSGVGMMAGPGPPVAGARPLPMRPAAVNTGPPGVSVRV